MLRRVSVPTSRQPDAPDASIASDAVPCHNCGTAGSGRFCAACGQERVALDAPTWRVLRGFFEEATDLDGRLVGTARALASPGRLTLAFLAGQRVRYVGPVKLFLAGGTALTATWLATRGVDARFYGLPAGTYGSAAGYIDAVVRGTVGSVGLMSVGSWVCALGRRRWLDEIVFALHLVATLSLGTAATIWIAAAWKHLWGTVAAVPSGIPELPLLLFAPAAAAGIAWTFAASRTVHGGPWWHTAIRTLVLVIAGAVALTSLINRPSAG